MGVMRDSIFCVAIVVMLACKNSGMYVYFSSTALKELLEGSVDYGIIDDINNRPIDDLHGDLLGGRMKWSFKDIIVTALAKPDVSARLNDSNMITCEVRAFTLSIIGSYEIRTWGIRTTGSFHGTVCVNGLVRLSMGSDAIIKVAECRANADCGMAIFIDDSHFKMPTIIQDALGSFLKDLFSSRMKDVVCRAIHPHDFKTSNAIIPLNQKFGLNVKVTKMVNFSKGGITLELLGDVCSTASSLGADNPYTMTDIKPLSFSATKMIEMVFTNYTVSTFVYNAIKQGCLDKFLQSRTLPPDQQIFLAVKCFNVCIGNFFPTLPKEFDDRLVDVDIVFDSKAISTIRDQNVTVYCTITLDFHIGNYSVVKVSMKTIISAVPYVVKGTVVIRGKLLDIQNQNIRVISSIVNDVPMVTLRWLSQIIKYNYLIPRMKEILDSGIDMEYMPLPIRLTTNSLGVMFRDAAIQLNKGSIDISVNLAFRSDERRAIPPTPPPKSLAELLKMQHRKSQHGTVSLV